MQPLAGRSVSHAKHHRGIVYKNPTWGNPITACEDISRALGRVVGEETPGRTRKRSLISLPGKLPFWSGKAPGEAWLSPRRAAGLRCQSVV